MAKTEFIVEVTHENVIYEEAKSIERYLIDFYGRRDLGQGSLVNQTDGGEGTSGILYTKERKDKIARSRKDFKYSEEAKSKISASRKGKALSDETKRRISEAHTGKAKIFTEEGLEKLKSLHKGKKWSEERKARWTAIRKDLFNGFTKPKKCKKANEKEVT